MKQSWRFIVIIGALGLMSLAFGLNAVTANGVSDTCINLDLGNGSFTNDKILFTDALLANEYISIWVHSPSPLSVELRVNNGTVDTQLTSATFHYTGAGNGDIVAIHANGSGTYATACDPSGPPPPPPPVDPPVVDKHTRPAHISDGRLNNADLSTTSAVYYAGDYIDVYAINPANSQGVRVIHYPKADLPASKPAENQTLEEQPNPFTGATIGLYLLSSGELQINTQEADGKDYGFRWSYL